VVGVAINVDEDTALLNVQDGNERLAIRIDLEGKMRPCPQVGDSIWWQGEKAMWTPRWANTSGKCGVDYDIQYTRIGYSH